MLVVDDWGLSSLQETERRDFLEILEDRHNQSSTIMASQIPIPTVLEPEISTAQAKKNWARLIQKVYETDPLVCSHCQGRPTVISFIGILLNKVPKHGTYISMRVCHTKLKELCRRRNVALSKMLRDAGVSKNAFYSLARKDSVLPKSLTAIAACLDVSPFDFLEEEHPQARKARYVHVKAKDIVSQHTQADYDTVVHTLLVLEDKPLVRLRRALMRGQKPDLH